MVSVFVAAATVIAMAEIDRLIAGVLTVEGRSSPLVSVIGPLALIGRDAWSDWASSAAADSVGWWIIASVLLDGVFIASYVWLVSRMPRLDRRHRLAPIRGAGPVCVDPRRGAGGGRPHRRRDRPDGDVESRPSRRPPARDPRARKLVLRGGRGPGDHQVRSDRAPRDPGAQGWRRAQCLGRRAKRLAQAVRLHRLSAVPVLTLFVFTCIPAADALDQLPDLQRQWVPNDWGSDWAVVWTAVRHILLAFGSVAIAAVAALILGRARTRALATSKTARDVPPSRKQARWWWAPILVWTALWVATGLTTGTWAAGWSAIAFLVVPGIVILSYCFCWPNAPWPITRRPDRDTRARWAWLTGDAIAVSIAGIAGLGLVRSFTAPVFTGALPDLESLTYWLSVVLLVFGLALAVASPFLLRAPGLRERTQRERKSSAPRPRSSLLDPEQRVDELPEAEDLRRLHLAFMVGFFVAGLLVLAWVGFYPVKLRRSSAPRASRCCRSRLGAPRSARSRSESRSTGRPRSSGSCVCVPTRCSRSPSRSRSSGRSWPPGSASTTPGCMPRARGRMRRPEPRRTLPTTWTNRRSPISSTPGSAIPRRAGARRPREARHSCPP